MQDISIEESSEAESFNNSQFNFIYDNLVETSDANADVYYELKYDSVLLGDGSSININKCGDRKCKEFCPRFLPSDKVYSHSLGRFYNCTNEDFPENVTCTAVNLIYVITCLSCYLQ